MENRFKDINLNFNYGSIKENKFMAQDMALIDFVSKGNMEESSILLEKTNNNINIKNVVVGELNTNCYIVENEEECLIIDPGDEFLKIKEAIDKKVVGVLLTHRHFDHIGALNKCLDYYNTDVYSFNNLNEGKNIINGFEFDVIFNPGHTMDSISFIFNNIMFSGDFIFKGTIGRWDIGGNIEIMRDSIRRILDSKINYVIYPGHGDSTMLDNERKMLESYIS